MSSWLYKYNKECTKDIHIKNLVKVNINDIIYIYSDDNQNGEGFLLKCKYEINHNKKPILIEKFTPREVDLPYTVLYKANSTKEPVLLNKLEHDFILNITKIPNRYIINLKTINHEHNHKVQPFKYKNILFKGVPGTGKSRAIDSIIKDKLKLDFTEHKDNILRVNIHSASSNADLMQGIGITTTTNDQVAYKEKQGLIYEHIRKACYTPNQPFVLVLEEIQENSLNELIGDLIYLIEPSKRLQIDKLQNGLSDKDEIPYLGDDGLITKYINNVQKYNEVDDAKLSIHSVKIPFLVETSTEYRELILPNNLYIFCTSNYRDDKKVIEDNLLRRFEVFELYPTYIDIYENSDIAKYLQSLNTSILSIFQDEEIHPDRFQIGHANWYSIEKYDNVAFYKALLKVVVEFKEIEFDKLHTILKTITLSGEESWIDLLHKKILSTVKNKSNYKTLIDFLQGEAYSDLF